MRVNINIKLGGGGDVSGFAPRAAHDDNFRYPLRNVWRPRERGRNIGQRSCWDEDNILYGPAEANNGVYRMFSLQR